jgi:Lipocalin-like domain
MFKVPCTVALMISAMATSAMAQTTDSPLVGLWKLVSWEAKGPENQTIKTYGEHPGGYYLFTKSGRMIFLMIGNNRTAPATTPPTDAEVTKLYSTLSAFDGTYKVEGNSRFVFHVDDSWNQSWTGTDQTREFKIIGNNLTVTFTTKNTSGKDIVVTVTSERTE